MIASAIRTGNIVQVRGSVADSSNIKHVTINGQKARSTRDSFAEWEITLEAPAGQRFELAAFAEDLLGYVEKTPHKSSSIECWTKLLKR